MNKYAFLNKKNWLWFVFYHLKVCATYVDGFRATAVCPVGGPRAVEKARRTAESIIKRLRLYF